MTNEQQIIENAPEGWTHVDVVNDKRHVYKERTIDDYRKRSDIERIAGLEKERDDTLVEASKLAMSIYNRCYRDKSDAVSIDLLDSTLGVMTQIDNMVAGVLQERDELKNKCEKLKLEAQIHASEDDTHKATVFDIYKVLGIQGKADWNGIGPVLAAVNNIKADAIEEALKALDSNRGNITPSTGREYLQEYANQLRNEVKHDTSK